MAYKDHSTRRAAELELEAQSLGLLRPVLDPRSGCEKEYPPFVRRVLDVLAEQEMRVGEYQLLVVRLTRAWPGRIHNLDDAVRVLSRCRELFEGGALPDDAVSKAID